MPKIYWEDTYGTGIRMFVRSLDSESQNADFVIGENIETCPYDCVSCTNKCDYVGQSKCDWCNGESCGGDTTYKSTCNYYTFYSCTEQHLNWGNPVYCPYGCRDGVCLSAPNASVCPTSIDISSPKSTYSIGDRFEFSVVIRDNAGNLIPNSNFTLSVNGSAPETTYTNSTGWFYYLLPSTVIVDGYAGTYVYAVQTFAPGCGANKTDSIIINILGNRTDYSKSFIISIGGAYCDSNNMFHARVVNTGTATITKSDWLVAEATNSTSRIVLVTSDVPIKGSADFTSLPYQGNPSPAYYTITIKTSTTTQKTVVSCQGEWTNQTCTAGWKCRDTMNKAYQSSNCSWGSSTYCPYGCSNGVCISAATNQTQNQTCPRGCICDGLAERCPNATQSMETNVSGATAGKISQIFIARTTGDRIMITSNATQAITAENIIVQNSKIYVNTSSGLRQVKFLPDDASSRAREVTQVAGIELKEETGKLLYIVKGTRNARLFFIIPVVLDVETRVDAENGDVVAVNKPWWSFLAW